MPFETHCYMSGWTCSAFVPQEKHVACSVERSKNNPKDVLGEAWARQRVLDVKMGVGHFGRSENHENH